MSCRLPVHKCRSRLPKEHRDTVSTKSNSMFRIARPILYVPCPDPRASTFNPILWATSFNALQKLEGLSSQHVSLSGKARDTEMLPDAASLQLSHNEDQVSLRTAGEEGSRTPDR
jgi:hypothetical protein